MRFVPWIYFTIILLLEQVFRSKIIPFSSPLECVENGLWPYPRWSPRGISEEDVVVELVKGLPDTGIDHNFLPFTPFLFFDPKLLFDVLMIIKEMNNAQL